MLSTKAKVFLTIVIGIIIFGLIFISSLVLNDGRVVPSFSTAPWMAIDVVGLLVLALFSSITLGKKLVEGVGVAISSGVLDDAGLAAFFDTWWREALIALLLIAFLPMTIGSLWAGDLDFYLGFLIILFLSFLWAPLAKHHWNCGLFRDSFDRAAFFYADIPSVLVFVAILILTHANDSMHLPRTGVPGTTNADVFTSGAAGFHLFVACVIVLILGVRWFKSDPRSSWVYLLRLFRIRIEDDFDPEPETVHLIEEIKAHYPNTSCDVFQTKHGRYCVHLYRFTDSNEASSYPQSDTMREYDTAVCRNPGSLRGIQLIWHASTDT